MKLSASYVGPDHFEQKQWFQVLIPGSVWFYHRPRKVRKAVSYSVLALTLDEDLHPIAERLTKLGLSTGPSCAGHDVQRPGCLNLYFTMMGDQIAVQSGGVTVQDVETGEQFRWRDNAFSLPWDCGEDFFRESKIYQLQGYLPVYGAEHMLAILKKRLLGVRYMSADHEGTRCVLRVRAPSLGLQRFAWLEGAKALGW